MSVRAPEKRCPEKRCRPLVTLRRGSDERYGIFKDVDIDLQSEVVRTNRLEREFTDR